MTVIKNSTILRDIIAALAADEQRTTQAVHDVIRDILDTRSAWLHAATADITLSDRRLNYNVVAQIDGLLLDALVLLPDRKPNYRMWITNPLTNEVLWLNEIVGEHAKYVTFDVWVNTPPEAMKVSPTPRRSRYEAELSTARQVLEVIKDIEAVGQSAVSFGDGKIDLEDIEAEPLTV